MIPILNKSYSFIKYITLASCFFIIISCGDKKIVLLDDQGNLSEVYFVNNNGDKHGEYRSYFSKDTLKEVSFYNNGQLSGKRTLYFQNGQVEIMETYTDNGILHGPYISYYPTGQKKLEKTYIENVIKGILTVYYPTGTTKEIVAMEGNQENGPFTEYYENGIIHWKGNYRNGDHEFGRLIEYDTLGNEIKIMQCDTQAICNTIWKLGMPPLTSDTLSYE